LINQYSSERDIVLDPFVGGGTTLIEAWLAKRQGYGIDINPAAITMSRARLQEMADHALKDQRVSLPENLRPVIVKGDSRELQEHMHHINVVDGSVKLVCTHPPYLDSLKYTLYENKDLSHISNHVEFCDQIQLVARQIFELLTDDGHCAVLMGDVRKDKEIIPLAFLVSERFLQEGFRLRNIIIKAQNNDSSTRFWYARRDKLDFLITHEYLFIFSK
jgi:DNA modification methylase